MLTAAALVLRFVFFAISIRSVPASSDEALAPLQAQRLLDGHVPLLVMANPYQFPLETYLYTPFIKCLPNNAFGVRLLPFLEGLGACLFFLLFLMKSGGLRKSWPGALLILFPSAYVLTLLSAYALPQHNSVVLISALTLYLAVCQRQARHPLLLAGAVGLLCGLGFSNHALVFPLFAMAGVFVCVNSSWREARRVTPAFLMGTIIGLLPYFAALWLMPGAYAPVGRTLGWQSTLQRLVSPVFQNALSGVMGINPCYFPDSKETLILVPGLDRLFTLTWAAVVIGVTLWRLVAIAVTARRSRWPVLQPVDMLIGATWLCIFAFAASSRSHSHTYRYLLPMAWSFPFLIGFLSASAGRWLRGATIILAMALAGYNVAASTCLMRQWARADFAQAHAAIYDLRPTIQYLAERGIRHCYASYWSAYRLNYESGGRLICSQPYNERFPGWGIPYKALVDQATNAAYVLAPRHSFEPKHLEADLKAMQVTSRKHSCGGYWVYSDFSAMTSNHETRLQPQRLEASASHALQHTGALTDGDLFSAWNSKFPQIKDMWVAVTFPTVGPVTRLTLQMPIGVRADAQRLRAWALDPSGWQPIAGDFVPTPERFEFINNHPVYGYQSQTISFAPISTRGLRVVIEEPDKEKRPWILNEIEIYVR